MMGSKTVLTTAILLFGATIVGCDSDDDTSYVASSAPEVIEILQATAAIEAAKVTFDLVAYDGAAAIAKTIGEGKADQLLTCSPTGTYRVDQAVGGISGMEGKITNNDCFEGDHHKWGGVIETVCDDTACTNGSISVTDALWGHPHEDIELITNGQLKTTADKDTAKGTAIFSKASKNTIFDFTGAGLIQEYTQHNTLLGSGALKITGGEMNNCVNGSYSYTIKTPLTQVQSSHRLTAGEIEIVSSSKVLGTATFTKAGVDIKTASGKTVTVAKAEFEGYCGLNDIYDYSEY